VRSGLHHLIEAQVRRTPTAVAAVAEDGVLAYAELDARANRLADQLRRDGIGPESLVAIYLERSTRMVVALLAVLKSGAAYVPLDPSYPRDRLAFMLEDARVAAVVTDLALAPTLPPSAARVLRLDTAAASTTVSAPGVSVDVHPDGLAYVIYTSGSTGRPKGAMNTYAGICNRLSWMQAAFRLSADDRVLQKTPLGFDVSVWEVFWPLTVGARVVLARPGGHRDNRHLVRAINEHGITVVHFVPSMLRAFLADPDVATCRSLRHLICSGEVLPPQLADLAARTLPAAVHNLYGPTEAAVDVTWWTCESDARRASVPIGWPITNVRIEILSDALTAVPPGAVGEICIGGVAIGRGYHRRPDLTAERFVADPTAHEAGARLYRTGDRGRYLADGTVEFLGRMDDQVKIRGVRVEPAEIEAVLRAHPAVEQAIVVAREHAPGDRRLSAYVVPVAGTSPAVAELRAHAAASLPDAMIPSTWTFTAVLPLTPSGKIDRLALQRLATGTEAELASLLADIEALSEDDALRLLTGDAGASSP
jgi:amino acid adenylation domain-containing protein